MEYVSFNQSWIGKYFFLKILRETQRYVSITRGDMIFQFRASDKFSNKKKKRERKKITRGKKEILEKFLDFAVIVLSSGERNGGQDIWRIYIFAKYLALHFFPRKIGRWRRNRETSPISPSFLSWFSFSLFFFSCLKIYHSLWTGISCRREWLKRNVVSL